MEDQLEHHRAAIEQQQMDRQFPSAHSIHQRIPQGKMAEKQCQYQQDHAISEKKEKTAQSVHKERRTLSLIPLLFAKCRKFGSFRLPITI